MPEFKDRTGETRVMNNGLKATIIAYRSSQNIDVQFEDGTIINNRTYHQFQRREIAHPQDRDNFINSKIGKTNLMYNGLKATIIAYRGAKDIDIQFEDGTIVKNKQYFHFRNGNIAHPQDRSSRFKDRTGETKVMDNGLEATIIAYKNNADVDVQFEDGTIVKNKPYDVFQKGKIININKDKYIGETKVMNNGLKATIINRRNYDDIDIQFEDGSIVEHKKQDKFNVGKIGHPLISKRGFSRNFYGYKLSKPIKINEDMVIYRAENLETKERELLTLQQILERTKNKELGEEEQEKEEVDREI